MSQTVYIEVAKDGWTGGMQLSIGIKDENNSGNGYRIHGPKFNGSSEAVLTHVLEKRDIEEIRSYLNKAEKLLENPHA